MEHLPLRFIHAADLHLHAPLGLGALASFFPEQSPALERLHPASNALQELNSGLILRQATLLALKRLEKLCQRWQPHFLVIAGDSFTEENPLPAQLALCKFCTRLFPLPIFFSCGNHDPLSARLEHISWPDNALFFGSQPEAFPVYGPADTAQEGQILAMVHGFSYAHSKETRNVAQMFKRGAEQCPHIGVLHTALHQPEENGPQAVCAPCTLSDLKAAGMDYWALGHVHTFTKLCAEPPIVYAGATQALNIPGLGPEEGPHGCVCVSIQTNTPQPVCTLDFHPLSPLQWHSLQICLEKPEESKQPENLPPNNDSPENLADLELFLRQCLFPTATTANNERTLNCLPQLNPNLRKDERCTPEQGSKAGSREAGSREAGSREAGSSEAGSKDAGSSEAGSRDAGSSEAGSKDAGSREAESNNTGRSDTGCHVVALRLVLTGRTVLDADLRCLQTRQKLQDALNEYALMCHSADHAFRLCIHDIALETSPLYERSQAVERPDLVGEVLREADAWNADHLAQKTGHALAELFSRSPRTPNHELFHLSAEEQNHVLTEAERLCVDLLEKN